MTNPARGGLMEGHGALHVEYPVSDGEPVGETDDHRDALLFYAVGVLKPYFAAQPDVYVSGNNFLYFVEGDPRAVVSPDTYVVKGVPNHNRDIYKVWEEDGHLPCFALEVTSKKTRHHDLGAKMSRYRDDLGVSEYFLFDPYGEWIPEQLRGFRLSDQGAYVPIPSNPQGRLNSEQLALELGVADRKLRFFPPGASGPLPTLFEKAATAEANLEAAEANAKAVEARAEAAEANAKAVEANAKAVEARAEAAEAEVARLKAELRQLRGES